MLRITRAGPDTRAEAILDLLRNCFATMAGRIDPPSSLNRMTTDDIVNHAQRSPLLLIEENENLIACLFVKPRADHFYLAKLAVHPDHQRKGLASRLITEADRLAEGAGAQFLELQTRVELLENHETFRSMGFVKVGETSHAGYYRPTSITMRRTVGRSGFNRPKTAI